MTILEVFSNRNVCMMHARFKMASLHGIVHGTLLVL